MCRRGHALYHPRLKRAFPSPGATEKQIATQLLKKLKPAGEKG